MSEWWNVNRIVQTWEGHGANHKMGRLHPAAGVEITDVYKGYGQINIDDVRFGPDGYWEDKNENPSYSEWWVDMDHLTKDPYEPVPDPDPDPEPDEPSNEEIGRVIRYLSK
jgi:hypothetical protein